MENMTFVAACRKFFGKDRGEVPQTLQEFAAEIKALTPKDKEELSTMFQTVGINVVEK